MNVQCPTVGTILSDGKQEKPASIVSSTYTWEAFVCNCNMPTKSSPLVVVFGKIDAKSKEVTLPEYSFV